MKHWALVAGLSLFSLTLTGCEGTYYAAMEKVGMHKRDILVDRVEDAQDAQQDAQQEFQSALEQLSSLIDFDGGELQTVYEKTQDAYDDSANAAARVNQRIEQIEDVASDLFDEWQDELALYDSATLRRTSEAKLKQTQRSYRTLLRVMKRAAAKMDPVLATLKDNALYLKHNLNAQAVGAIQGEYANLQQDIEQLINEMNLSIRESEKFLATLENR